MVLGSCGDKKAFDCEEKTSSGEAEAQIALALVFAGIYVSRSSSSCQYSLCGGERDIYIQDKCCWSRGYTCEVWIVEICCVFRLSVWFNWTCYSTPRTAAGCLLARLGLS